MLIKKIVFCLFDANECSFVWRCKKCDTFRLIDMCVVFAKFFMPLF